MTAFADRRTGLEVLDRAACLALLETHEVGRLAVSSGGAAEIFPVNYVVDGDAVVFRSAAGTKVRLAGRADVAFEIDELDGATRTGWSVVLRGTVDEVPDHLAATYADAMGLDPWAAGEKPHVLRIVPTSITGRRVTAT